MRHLKFATACVPFFALALPGCAHMPALPLTSAEQVATLRVQSAVLVLSTDLSAARTADDFDRLCDDAIRLGRRSTELAQIKRGHEAYPDADK